MKILVTGSTGQVGWELCRSLLPVGEIVSMDRKQADLSKPESLASIIREVRPNVVVNAAAYTAVDRAEDEEEVAMRVNAASVQVLAEETRRIGALLVHYSTDYVFDGTMDRPYSEDDIVNPLNAYGRTKLAGEQAIQALAADWLILRTSWIYSARGSNFAKTVLRLAKDRAEMRIVGDQLGSPTWAPFVADATAHVLKHASEERSNGDFRSGIYHLTNEGYTSWFDFACHIVAVYRERSTENGLAVRKIVSIPTSEYSSPAKRPLNSRLACDRIQARFGVNLPNWKRCVEACLRELA